MPIKLPKGFQRRKSSGNVLDEVQNPVESSFRVFERGGTAGKSLDGHILVNKAGNNLPPPISKNSFERDEEDLFSVARPDATNRGSGGTDNSLSTAPYDSAASSARLSTSTNPSSIDARSDRNVQVPGQRPFADIPIPPPPSARTSFLRNPGRHFSLGVGQKGYKDQADPQPSLTGPPATPAHRQGVLGNGRDRAMTASSASTATPPQLFDSDLALENSELDGFENIFDHIGLRSRDVSPAGRAHATLPSSPPISYPPTSFPGGESLHPSRPSAPRPIVSNKPPAVESSPFSFTSHDSREGLMRSPSPSKTITQNSPPPRLLGMDSPQSPSATTRLFARKPVSQEHSETRPDFQELIQSPKKPTASGIGLGLKSAKRQSVREQSLPSMPGQDVVLDPSLLASAELAVRYQNSSATAPKQPTTKKVMTPAQFERYKQEQEMDRRRGLSADPDSDDEADKYDDDDDLEHERQAAKQRRKQEAHLAVYRQTMMKVTGEQANARTVSSLSLPLGGFGNSSTTDLNNRLSRITVDTKQSGKSSGEEDDDDDDVPLGILAAHGFPNKNRPPARLSTSPSNSNMRNLGQQAPAPQSVVGDSGKRGSLPVFARHLPQDPYYGAGLVNPSNRESLSIHGAVSAPATPSGASTAHPLHPSGLVGVIAGEERARAMRRGSPNAQGNYDEVQHPGMMHSQSAGNVPQMAYPGMMPGMPPMLTPGDQAQIQMSQQMTQMMQMQMQWMQQMQAMMGNPGHGMPPQMMLPGMSPNFLAPPEPMYSAPGPGQRTMSTLNSGMAPWQAQSGGNYAHSIAPSERSNVGLASRYRPVSVIQEPEMSKRRASTFTSASFRPWSQIETPPKPPPHSAKPSLSHVGRRSPLVPDDEDDEQGWAEMKMKKEKKQKTWKLRKGQNALQELFNGAP